ncbi:MAG: hypothetical protein DHS20C14_17010 [Phycisphaeraceae bacterium]|nr:MAG: hypothetical protein DHS20C14_17010 [Phycisphaeraceae bacterium]
MAKKTSAKKTTTKKSTTKKPAAKKTAKKTAAKSDAASTAYAIIEESGGQRMVAADEQIIIDLHNGGESKPGDTIDIDKVLVVGDRGGSAKVGTPYVAGASVTLEITEPVVMGDKLYIYKIRPKKDSRRKTGHRQRYTGVKVASING